MPLPNPDDLAAVVLKRHDCLRELVDRPQAKRELVDSLEMPRSTLDDVVRELEGAGLVEYRDGTWYPTQSGRLACQLHCEYCDRLASLTDAAPILTALDATCELDWAFVDGAEIHETHPSVPDAVMTTLLEHVEAATTVRVVTPNLVAGYVERLYRSGVSGRTASMEMIVPPAVDEWLRSQYPAVTTELIDDPAASAFRAAVPFSFGLSIFDDERAALTVFTEQGIAGLVVNDSTAALDWATRRYESVKRNAEPAPVYDGVH